MFDAERTVAQSIGVPVAKRHIFLCCDQTKPKCCDKDRGLAAWDYLLKMKRRGVNIRVTSNSYSLPIYSQALKEAIAAAGDEGILTVVAAGCGAARPKKEMTARNSFCRA